MDLKGVDMIAVALPYHSTKSTYTCNCGLEHYYPYNIILNKQEKSELYPKSIVDDNKSILDKVKQKHKMKNEQLKKFKSRY